MIYRFGAYELDEAKGELRRGSEAVALQPKPFALLVLLVRERARVVSLDELFETLWPGTVVTPASLTRAVSHARKAVGDTHKGQLIRSFARRGYRFFGDVVEIDDAPAPPAAKLAASQRGRRRSGSPQNDDPSVVGDDPFVGRDAALQKLRDAWTTAEGGRSTLALISGPAGIGKTRLVEVFGEEVAARGPLLITARAREGEGVPAFWLWAQVLRQLLSEPHMQGHLRELAVRPGELAGLVPDLVPDMVSGPVDDPPRPAAGRSADQSRFLLFDSVTRTLGQCSGERPLVLILEDLQWAGSPSLRLLEHLIFEARDAKILVIGTVRDEARHRGHPLNRTFSVLRQFDRCVRIELGAFSRGEVAGLLAQVLGTPAPSDLTSELYARTEGVPLFVREAIRLLRERGDLKQPERVPRRGIELPDHAIEFIRRALDALSDGCEALMGAASVIGREFGLSTLASVANVEREEALDLLDEATQKGVVQPVADRAATYRFSHALFQESAYEALLSGARARLHARVAERLEHQHGDDLNRVIAELAHHHLRGIAVGDPERAYEYAVRAAESAAALCAYEQAAGHHEQALAALDHADAVDPRRRLDTLIALSEAHRIAGERDRRLEVCREAASSAKSLGRVDAFARAAIGFCDISEWSPLDNEAESVLKEAHAALEAERDSVDDEVVLRARLLTRIAYLRNAALRRGLPESDQEQTIALAREAMRLARIAGEPEALQEASYIVHYVVAGPTGHDERRALAAEIHAAAVRSTTHEVTIISHLDVACDRLSIADRAGAIEYRSRAVKLAGDAPTASMTWHLMVYDAGVALLEGRFAEAEEKTRSAVAIGRRIAHPVSVGCYNAHRVRLAQERGDHQEVVRIFEPVLQHPEHPVAWVKSVVGRARFRLGHQEGARALFEELSAQDFDDVPRGIRWTVTIAELAGLCADLGDKQRAALLIDTIHPHGDQHGVLPLLVCYAGPLAWPKARLHQLLGNTEEADLCYADALASADQLGARPAVARIGLDYAVHLDQLGESDQATALRSASLALAEELGMPEVAGKARFELSVG